MGSLGFVLRCLAVTGCFAIALLLGAASAQADTVPLGYDQDTSSYPSVFFSPEALERAESFRVLLTADPEQSFEYEQSISCSRGSESISLKSPAQVVTPPFATTILPTLSEPDSCWIWVSAEAPFEDAVPGTVRIEVTGSRRPAPPPVVPPPPVPYWIPCSIPGWLRSGEAKVHGEVSCPQARLVASKAWRRPTKAGTVVKVRRYICRRNEVRGSATVRCSQGTKIVKVTGRLR